MGRVGLLGKPTVSLTQGQVTPRTGKWVWWSLRNSDAYLGRSQHPLSSLDRTGFGLKITHMNGLIFKISLLICLANCTPLQIWEGVGDSGLSWPRVFLMYQGLREMLASCTQPSYPPTRMPPPIPRTQRPRVCLRSYSLLREGVEFKDLITLYPHGCPTVTGCPHTSALLGTSS